MRVLSQKTIANIFKGLKENEKIEFNNIKMFYKNSYKPISNYLSAN